jgi:hypothetical protein
MKAGDHLICKPTSTYFNENSTYKIEEIRTDIQEIHIKITTTQHKTKKHIKFTQLVKFTNKNRRVYSFWLTYTPYIWEHFYTLQELRTLKLNQLDESRR